MEELPVGADLAAAQFAHLAGGVVEVIERRDRLAELEMLGAEDKAFGDGDAVVDDDARVVRNVGQGLGDGGAREVVEHEAAFQADDEHAGAGGFGEKPGTSGQGMVHVRAA